MSKSFEALQKHAINLELALQQYKGIAISELKKLTEKMKGKSVETKFEKSSVIRQLNAFKSQIAPILDLEVSFRKSTCYIRDLKGNDLLTASSSQAWLWHRRLSHLHFDTINFLSKYDIVTGLPKLKLVKDHLCSSCELGKAKRKSFHTKTTPRSKRQSKDETPEVLVDFPRLVQRGLHAQVRTIQTDKGTKFLNKTLHAYFAQEGIEHQTSTARTPEQNSVIKRRNCTLVEADRIMLSAAKVPCSLCYIVRDGENLDKMKDKGDAYHVSSDPVPQCPTTALEHDSLSPGPQSQENVPQAAETVTTSNELDFLFSLIKQQHTTPSTSTTVAADHPLEQVIGNPSQSIRTRRQLETDGEMCMFALTVSQTEPKNIKEAMADSASIEAMQEELH
ncbi:retrovirus-related pol polyprotein from transposon TNT 1-94 [Tanacetum coccineum]